jgi:predicted XRE-type DNA-binding protein
MENLLSENMLVEKGEIVVYQPDEITKLEVRVRDETVWLTQEQIAQLFGVKRPAITKHIRNIFQTQELEEISVCSILELTAADGKKYMTQLYNLDMILSIRYRVNSRYAMLFRRWANSVLKEYLLKGYSIHYKINEIEEELKEHKQMLDRHEEKIDFFVRSSLPPVEGVFFDGQVYDAYAFVAGLIRKAQRRIVLIDNYIDETVLTMLDKRNNGVNATIYTSQISKQLKLDIQKHNVQYDPITIKVFKKAHDRFLIIDDEVYLIGASLKDLGKKCFGFTLMEHTDPETLLNRM